jgi:hypothetical protein
VRPEVVTRRVGQFRVVRRLEIGQGDSRIEGW